MIIFKIIILQIIMMGINKKQKDTFSYVPLFKILRWKNLNPNFLAYHKQNYFEALPPSPLHQQICNDLEKRKRQESETSSFYDLFRVKADLLEDIDWFLPRAHQHPKRPHHYLFVGLFNFKNVKSVPFLSTGCS